MAGTGDATSGTSDTSGASAVGTWGVEAQGQPSLTLGEDGRVAGTDGCNRIMGGWKQEDTIVFTGLASTKMFCEGVDTWLGNADSASISGSTMTVMDSTGATIGTLERATTSGTSTGEATTG